MNNKASLLGLIIGISLINSTIFAATFHVRPDGNNNNSGLKNTPQDAWRTIDRGQPTRLIEAIKEGQTEIKVARAVQFPMKGTAMIGKVEVQYTGRTNFTLTGCKGTPKARNGTIVSSNWRPPQAGDTVIVHPGVYYALNNWPEEKGLHKYAVSITSGGTVENPVIFTANVEVNSKSPPKGGVKSHLGDMPVLDGRHLAYALSLNNVHNVVFDGFDIRRNCVLIWQSSGIKILNSRIHEGRQGLSVRYSDNVEIAGNQFYDFHGAWTTSPISLGKGNNYYVHNNTIALSSRAGISIFDKTGADFRIEKNIITRCRSGINVTKDVNLKAENVKENCLWNLGKVTWLGRVAQKKEGIDYYKGLKFTPNDLYEDPGIISFDPDSPYFMDITKNSPCATKTGIIGAGKVINKYPVNLALKNNNLVINQGFENGWNGWSGSAWQPFKPGQAGWRIVSTPGQTGRKCLEIFHFPPKDQIQPRVSSNFVRIDRGYPVTLSFRAKSSDTTNKNKSVFINASLLVPSWHYGSYSASAGFNITDQWKDYKATLKPEDYYPNIVAATFQVRGAGRVWVDDVVLSQHTDTSNSKSEITVDLAKEIPGSLVSGKKIKIAVTSLGIQSHDLKVEYSFATPNGQFAKTKNLKLTINQETKYIVIPLPGTLTGAALLRIKIFENSHVVANGIYRLIIGQPAPAGRNKDFFGVNPIPSMRNPAELEDLKKKYKTAADLGIGTWHYYLNIERMKSACEEPWVEKMVDAANEAGIEWLWTLQNSKLFTGKLALAPGPGNLGEMINGQIQVNDLDKGRLTEKQFKLWEAWVAALVKKYKGKVKYWEICNEPNTYLNAEEYLKILKRTSPIIRKIAPDAVIIGGSLVNAFRTPIWNKTISEGNAYFDQFSYHPYRFGLSNPFYGGFPKNLKIAQEDLKKIGSKYRIALTEEFRESGPPMIDYSSRQEKNEANNLARMYVRALGENCASYFRHHELFRDSNMAPSLGLAAIHTMATLLNNAKPVGKLKTSTDYVAYLFDIPKGSYPPKSLSKMPLTLIALWTKDVNYAGPVEITLPKTITNVKVFNLYGNQVPVKNNRFLVGRDLVYIILPKIEPEKAKQLLGNMFIKLKSIPGKN